MVSSLAFMQIKPRKGLLKDDMDEGKLKGLLAKINSDSREEVEKDIRAFMQNEEELIQQGYEGKCALFYEGKCWGILNEQEALLNSFYKEVGYKDLYLDRIGGGREILPPHITVPKN